MDCKSGFKILPPSIHTALQCDVAFCNEEVSFFSMSLNPVVPVTCFEQQSRAEVMCDN